MKNAELDNSRMWMGQDGHVIEIISLLSQGELLGDFLIALSKFIESPNDSNHQRFRNTGPVSNLMLAAATAKFDCHEAAKKHCLNSAV